MKRCGLLGERLGHSYSPAIHAQLGDYAYRLYECPREKLGDFLKTGDFDGLNVTIPYKKAVIPYCAELSPMAAAIGSVNTLLRRPDGTLYGDNTDAFGFESLLRHASLDPKGKKCLVLGSGGASVTVQAVLRHLGAGSVTVISRSGEDNYHNLPPSGCGAHRQRHPRGHVPRQRPCGGGPHRLPELPGRGGPHL